MMNREDLQRAVEEYDRAQSWNHNFQLPFGIETRPGEQTSHGKNLVKYSRLLPIFQTIELQGKRVLDVGCNEGYFSFAMRDLGATVTGVDADAHRIAKAEFIARIHSNDRVEFSCMDIYSPAFEKLGHFDVCLCLGLLHRIPDPVRAINSLANRSNLIVFEWRALKFGPHDDSFAYFSRKPIDPINAYGTEYWLMSFSTVEEILKRSGFTHFFRVDDSTQRRAILVAGQMPAPVFFHPNVVRGRGRLRSVLSHTRQYLRTIYRILSGAMNA